MDFDTEADRKKIDKIIEKFEHFWVCAVNVTYERYRFNKRAQDVNVDLGELRRLARAADSRAWKNQCCATE